MKSAKVIEIFLKRHSRYIMEFIDIANTINDKDLSKKLEDYLLSLEVKSDALKPEVMLPQQIQNFFNSVNSIDSIGGKSFLFYGEPGTGKTMTVNLIAEKLDLPVKNINYNNIISKRLGESSKNLENVIFDNNEEILLFDEFDIVLSDRHSYEGNEEMKRVTSSLLKLIDEIPKNKVAFFVTNIENKIDSAILRRINRKFGFNQYKKEDLVKIYKKLLAHSEIYSLENKYLIKDTFFKKIINLFNSKTTPAQISLSINSADKSIEETGEPNYFLIIEPFIKELGVTDKEITFFLFKNDFSINEIFVILRKEYKISNDKIRKWRKEYFEEVISG